MSTALTNRSQSVGKMIASRAAMINSLFRNEEDAKRFRAIAVAVTANKNLAECSDDSIISCIMGVAQLRLSIDPNLGHAYIIPYHKKDKDGKVLWTVAQLQVGYKGFVQLLYRAGWTCDTYPIYSCDKFEIAFNNEKMSFTYDFEVNFDDREEDDNDWVYQNLKGVLVVMRDDRGNVKTEFISKAKIEKIRMKSENQKKKDKPEHIWGEWYEEQARKSALKKVAKTTALGDERVALAIAVDDKISTGSVIDVEKSFTEGTVIEAESEPVQPQTEQPKNINNNPLFVLKQKLKTAGINDAQKFCEKFEINDKNAESMVNDEAGLQSLIEKFKEDNIQI